MPESSLLPMADHVGREQRALRDDLRHMLFPTSGRPPTERQVAEIRLCLASWIGRIETFLLSGDEKHRRSKVKEGGEGRLYPECWSVLAASGLLADDILLRHAMTQLFLLTVERQDREGAVDDHRAGLARLAACDDALLADAAMNLIAAHMRHLAARTPELVELPVAMLNLLAWRVVAAHEVIEAGRREALSPRVVALLSQHDERSGLLHSADLLAHKMFEARMVSTDRPEIAPERQGLPLSLALAALAADMPVHAVVEMAGEFGLSRLALLLRALDYHPRETARLLGWISVRAGGEMEVMRTLAAYEDTAQATAEKVLAAWRATAWREEEL